MIKFNLFCIFICSFFSLFAQDQKVYFEQDENGYTLFADNNNVYPVSMLFDFETQNLNFSEKDNRTFVIPAKSEKFKIGMFTVAITGKKYKFSFKYGFTMGDVTLTKIDTAYQYNLPFPKGNSFKIYQGYNGTFSHQNENALDFEMPEDTDVTAARDGIIVFMEQNNTTGCPKPECAKYNNVVIVMHPDGSFASYAHIKYNSVKFAIGNSVKKGDVLASSGNVGFSSGPHLHFVFYIAAFYGKTKSIKTVFKINNGNEALLLVEGKTYTRNY